MEEKYNKLVRDKIPEIIKINGEEPITRVLTEEEYKKALEKKLLEECYEVLASQDKKRLEELADLLEVMKYLSQLENSSIEEVTKIGLEKNEKRGSFKNRIFLEKVITKKK